MLEQAIETYRLDNLDFPADLQALVENFQRSRRLAVDEVILELE